MNEGIVIGSGASPERVEGCGQVIDALRPAVILLANIMPAMQLLDGLMSLYLNVAIAVGADTEGLQSAMREAADLLPEAIRRSRAMAGHQAGNA